MESNPPQSGSSLATGIEDYFAGERENSQALTLATRVVDLPILGCLSSAPPGA